MYSIEIAIARFPLLGYTYAVDLLDPTDSKYRIYYDTNMAYQGAVRWRKEQYNLIRLYEENLEILRESAPDRRTFLFESKDGIVRPVRGYRGSSDPLSRRGLPVYDARMLVNVVSQSNNKLFLDPFAGVGGIILEALKSNYSTIQ
jgi:hypothetical protein